MRGNSLYYIEILEIIQVSGNVLHYIGILDIIQVSGNSLHYIGIFEIIQVHWNCLNLVGTLEIMKASKQLIKDKSGHLQKRKCNRILKKLLWWIQWKIYNDSNFSIKWIMRSWSAKKQVYLNHLKLFFDMGRCHIIFNVFYILKYLPSWDEYWN